MNTQLTMDVWLTQMRTALARKQAAKSTICNVVNDTIYSLAVEQETKANELQDTHPYRALLHYDVAIRLYKTLTD